MRAHRHTQAELDVIAATVQVQRAYTALERVEGASHPSHAVDVTRAVHDVQRVVAMRLARRVEPGTWGFGC